MRVRVNERVALSGKESESDRPEGVPSGACGKDTRARQLIQHVGSLMITSSKRTIMTILVRSYSFHQNHECLRNIVCCKSTSREEEEGESR